MRTLMQFLFTGVCLCLGLLTLGYFGLNHLLGIEQTILFVRTHKLLFMACRALLYLTLFISYQKLKQRYPEVNYRRANYLIIAMLCAVELANLLTWFHGG